MNIFKSNWIDLPYPNSFHGNGRGFSDYPGIYLCLAGSNSAYGNQHGGFISIEHAEQFKNDNDLGDNWKVSVRK